MFNLISDVNLCATNSYFKILLMKIYLVYDSIISLGKICPVYDIYFKSLSMIICRVHGS